VTGNQFFIESLPEGKGRFFLEGKEHYHLCKVSRIKKGDRIWLTDGRSRRLLAEVEKIGPDKTWLLPLERVEESLRTGLVLGSGITKPQTMDFIIQKATELGVAEILPLITRRSFSLERDKMETKLKRWQRISREALKQSKGAVLPVIRQPMPLKEAVIKARTELKFYLNQNSQVYFRDILNIASPQSVTLLVGPEGGWAEEETEIMERYDVKGLTLGGRVLRTETAIIGALSLISHYWNW